MILSFSTALSGLNANSSAINVIGNDLANLNTTGYKANQVHFSDLISQQLGVPGSSGQTGMGVSKIKTSVNYTQGSLQNSNGATDAAVQGNGFFVVKSTGNQTLYTRDGSFQVNSAGQLTTSGGEAIQGWSAVGGVLNTNSAIGNISVPLGAAVPATATSKISLAVNLDSRSPTTGTGNSFSTPIQVVDSLGSRHTVTATFNKTAANTWSYSLAVPPAELTAGGTGEVATGTLTFDSMGKLATPALANPSPIINIAGLAGGAADMNITWDLRDSSGVSTITQFADTSAAAGSVQNGYASGQINKISLQDGGLLVANYSNGQQVTVGQLALASISNPNTLISVGGNRLAATASTAEASVGTANSGPRGQIVAGALEGSTVDIAQAFTNLLTFQRGYQANSRVITTTDQLLQETVNLIRA